MIIRLSKINPAPPREHCTGPEEGLLRLGSQLLGILSYLAPVAFVSWQNHLMRTSDHGCGMWILAAMAQGSLLAIVLSALAALLNYLSLRTIPKPWSTDRLHELFAIGVPAMGGLLLILSLTGLIIIPAAVVCVMLAFKHFRHREDCPPPLPR